MNNDLYMACIDLHDRPVLVVGGGPVALEKVNGLLAAGAGVTVVAPRGVAAIGHLDAFGAIKWHRRPYEGSDLDDRFLVVAATGVPEVERRVHLDATARNILVNVADVPHLCNFILPAVAREGPLAVAVSTAGASPALAKRMKREAAAMFGAPYAELAEILRDLRPWAKANLPTYAARRDLFEDVVNGSPDPIDLLAAGRTTELARLIERAKTTHLARATGDHTDAASA